MEAIAKTKYLKGSPRKARLVIDLIRGRNVSQARAILKFTDKRAAHPIAKCLNSAIANATYLAEQQNIAIDPDDLWVRSCFVDMGPTKNRRRMRPAPQGRAYREQRHYCHITIQLTSEEIVDKNAKRSGPVKDEAAQSVKTSTKKDEVKETKTANEEIVEETAETVEETVIETVEETVPATAETVEETTPETTETVAQAESEKQADEKE